MAHNPRALNGRQLEAFRAVMIAGSITGGSRLLSVSQPAVSRLIHDLECDLRMQLFLREGASIIPTPEGRELFREVERYFISTERIREAAMAIREYSSGRLRVATILALTSACIPEAVAEFARTYPSMLVSVHSGPSIDIVDLVADGSADIGFVARSPTRGDLKCRDLPPFEAVCLIPSAHELAARPVIEPADMHERDFIALGSSSMMRMELNAILQAAGVHPRIRVESLFSSTVAEYVARGLGIAVVDPLAPGTIDRERTTVRRFLPTIPYELSVVWPARSPFTAPMRRFVDAFVGAYRNQIDETRRLMGAGLAMQPAGPAAAVPPDGADH